MARSFQKTALTLNHPWLNGSHTKELAMADLPPNIPDCTIFLLAKAYQKAHADFKKRLHPFSLTNLQHLVLEALWYREGMTATELGKFLVLDKATLSGVLDRLVDSDWIRKEPDPEDRRVLRLYPSEKAEKMKAPLIELRREANEDLLSIFAVEEQVLLKRFLRDLM
jgi:DNA-binding MarR family transcriptional regulator